MHRLTNKQATSHGAKGTLDGVLYLSSVFSFFFFSTTCNQPHTAGDDRGEEADEQPTTAQDTRRDRSTHHHGLGHLIRLGLILAVLIGISGLLLGRQNKIWVRTVLTRR